MRIWFLGWVCLWGGCVEPLAPASQLVLLQRVPLDERLREISGTAYVADELFAHNDSGDGANLYRVDAATGSILEVHSYNLPARDWESLAVDETHLFIGDFGNNSGTRTDLRIFKIPLAELGATTPSLDTLALRFAAQEQPPVPDSLHDFDVEASYVQGDSLWLFSKNRSGSGSRVYVMPKTAGTYVLTPRHHLALPGSVTGADRRPDGAVALCGYRMNGDWRPFLRIYPRGLLADRWIDTSLPDLQIESVVWHGTNELLLGAEGEGAAHPTLLRIGLE